MDGEVFAADLINDNGLGAQADTVVAEHELLIELFRILVDLQAVPVAGDGIQDVTPLTQASAECHGVLEKFATQTFPIGKTPLSDGPGVDFFQDESGNIERFFGGHLEIIPGQLMEHPVREESLQEGRRRLAADDDNPAGFGKFFEATGQEHLKSGTLIDDVDPSKTSTVDTGT